MCVPIVTCLLLPQIFMLCARDCAMTLNRFILFYYFFLNEFTSYFLAVILLTYCQDVSIFLSIRMNEKKMKLVVGREEKETNKTIKNLKNVIRYIWYIHVLQIKRNWFTLSVSALNMYSKGRSPHLFYLIFLPFWNGSRQFFCVFFSAFHKIGKHIFFLFKWNQWRNHI